MLIFNKTENRQNSLKFVSFRLFINTTETGDASILLKGYAEWYFCLVWFGS